MKTAPAIDRYCTAGERRALKRRAARAWRRRCRQLGDDAPRRRGFAGWWS